MTRHARRDDPDTSKAASAEVEASTLSTHKARVLAAIRATGADGMTWKEAEPVADVTNCWRRCSDLLDDGAIVATGETRHSPETGRAERIYVAAEFAADYDPVQTRLI